MLDPLLAIGLGRKRPWSDRDFPSPHALRLSLHTVAFVTSVPRSMIDGHNRL